MVSHAIVGAALFVVLPRSRETPTMLALVAQSASKDFTPCRRFIAVVRRAMLHSMTIDEVLRELQVDQPAEIAISTTRPQPGPSAAAVAEHERMRREEFRQ